MLPDRLRFDFSHSKVVEPAAMKRIEDMCIQHIGQDLPVHSKDAPLEQAKQIRGEDLRLGPVVLSGMQLHMVLSRTSALQHTMKDLAAAVLLRPEGAACRATQAACRAQGLQQQLFKGWQVKCTTADCCQVSMKTLCPCVTMQGSKLK